VKHPFGTAGHEDSGVRHGTAMDVQSAIATHDREHMSNLLGGSLSSTGCHGDTHPA
jgi:hypothetical protein